MNIVTPNMETLSVITILLSLKIIQLILVINKHFFIETIKTLNNDNDNVLG